MWYPFKIWVFKPNDITEIHEIEVSAHSEWEAMTKADLEGDALSGYTGQYDFEPQFELSKSTLSKYFE